MPNTPTETEVFNASIKTSYASGNGLAMRGIMIDAMQRYYASDTSHASTQAKKDLIIHFAEDAAHEAKDGVTVLKVFNLDLTTAQKELAARGWKNFLESKSSEQLAGFLDEPALKSAVQSIPVLRSSPAGALTEAAYKAVGKGAGKDFSATQDAKEVGKSPTMGQLWDMNNTFETVASAHKIMYYKENGVEQELWNSLGKGIDEAKMEIAHHMCANTHLTSQQSKNFSCPAVQQPKQPGIQR
jgi:hypothetical protein